VALIIHDDFSVSHGTAEPGWANERIQIDFDDAGGKISQGAVVFALVDEIGELPCS